MRIYLVGSITGQDYDTVVRLIEGKKTLLEKFGYEVFHPMLGKEFLRNEIEFKSEGYKNPASTNHAIFNRDLWMVAQSDIILADFTSSGERVSIGSMFELAWASAYNKHVIVVMDKDNIHRHAFVLEAATIVFTTIYQAMDYLSKLKGFEG